MKKLIVYIIFVLCLFSITGCTRFSPSSPNETPSENNADIQQLSPNVSAETTPVQTDSNEYIGEDAAEAAALEHANISETDVTWIWTQLDFDDGRMIYDVEFICGNEEYDYEIDALTGEILSYDYDMESSHPQNQPSGNNTEYITSEEAKAIALAKAEISETDVTFKKEAFDYDDGIAVYDIEFIYGDKEYEFEINATDGTILDYSVESIWN